MTFPRRRSLRSAGSTAAWRRLLSALRSLVVFAGALLPLSSSAAELSLSKDDVGQLWIQIVGRIDDGDDIKFKTMLLDAIHRQQQIINVSLYSPGGRVLPAMEIGRMIRIMHLATVAPDLIPIIQDHICRIYTTDGHSTALEYKPWLDRGDRRCTCLDECFLIWAAGATRIGGAVQIRRGAFKADHPSGPGVAGRAAGDQQNIEAYLLEMGVSKETVDRLFSLGSDKAVYLTRRERDLLEHRPGLPRTEVPYRERCHRYAATSPAALACEKAVTREFYWEGAKRLWGQND
jgi:hypothetical protein